MSSEKIQKTIRKSEMSAQNSYDYGKLVFPRSEFIDCSFEEKKEEVIFTYEVKGYKKFQGIRKEQRDVILINLIDCAKMAEVGGNYKFSLAPDNLFYDIHNQIFILGRDVYGKGEEFNLDHFLKQYKALIGFSLQTKYSYEDYFNGGMELLNKDKFLSKIAVLDSIEKIKECLTNEYEELTEKYRETKIFVDKRKSKQNKILLAVSGCLLIASLAFIGEQVFYVQPYEQAVVHANRSYLKLDYSKVIDSFKKIKLNRLTVYDKYILAYSYIQCESLTGEQKENIMNALSLETNEKVLDYWIYLGKLNVDKAEDIAQQISDNDLLLYAYLKDKSMVEENTKMSGSKKEQYLEDLDSKIEKLSSTYSDIEDKESSKAGKEETDNAKSSSESEATGSSDPAANNLDDIDVVE